MTKFNNDHQPAYQNVRPIDADQSLQRVSALFTAMSAIAAVREESPIILGETLELQNDIAVLREMFDNEIGAIEASEIYAAKLEADQIKAEKLEQFKTLEQFKKETTATVKRFKNQQKKVKAILEQNK